MKNNFNASKTFTLRLSADSTIENVSGFLKESNFRFKSEKIENFWTMIYDEGFELRYNGHRIFVFSEYYLNPNKNDRNSKHLSNCAKTLVGWYKKENSD